MKAFVIIFDLILISSGASMVASMLLLRLTLTRRIKKKQREAGGYYWDTGTLDFGFLNTIAFMLVCAFPPLKNQGNGKIYIPRNVEVRDMATGFEIFLSYACVVSTSLIMLAILIYYPTDYFGLIDWNAANLP